MKWPAPAGRMLGHYDPWKTHHAVDGGEKLHKRKRLLISKQNHVVILFLYKVSLSFSSSSARRSGCLNSCFTKRKNEERSRLGSNICLYLMSFFFLLGGVLNWLVCLEWEALLRRNRWHRSLLQPWSILGYMSPLLALYIFWCFGIPGWVWEMKGVGMVDGFYCRCTIGLRPDNIRFVAPYESQLKVWMYITR